MGCGKQREATAPIQSLVKLLPWFRSLRWKTCLRQNCSLGSCACSEGPALGQTHWWWWWWWIWQFQNPTKLCTSVHRCGPGATMRTCHAAGPCSIPGRDKFPGWGFFGVFPHLWDKCREALGPQGPRISFGHHHPYSFITGANDLRCWRSLKPQIYILCTSVP